MKVQQWLSSWLLTVGLVSSLLQADTQTQSKTIVSVVHPIIKALCEANKFVGNSVNCWNPVHSSQKKFLERFMPSSLAVQSLEREHGLFNFTDDELIAQASTNVDELNNLLKKRGFSIELQPLAGDAFGIVSILEVLLQWVKKGEETTIVDKTGKKYAAAQLRVEKIVTAENSGYQNPVAVLATQSGDKVYLTVADEANIPTNSFELIDRIAVLRNIVKDALPSRAYAKKVIVPMIDLDISEEMGWLLGMQLQGNFGGYTIRQALQQTIFKMNTMGVLIKSAVGLVVERSVAVQKLLVIDRPFYIWVERPGVKEPVFAGYITQEHWKNPGDFTK